MILLSLFEKTVANRNIGARDWWNSAVAQATGTGEGYLLGLLTRFSNRHSMKLNTHKIMLRAVITLAVLLGLFGKSLAEDSTGGCAIETLKHEAIVARCINHDGTDRQYLDNCLAPVATNCIITCKQGDGVTYRVCDTDGYWNGPALKCVDLHDSTRKMERRVKRGWLRSVFRGIKNIVKVVVKTVIRVACATGFLQCGRPGPPPDRTRPSIVCPSDIYETADAFQDSTTVHWEKPDPYDDRDGKVTAECQSWHRPGQRFSEGTTTITYEAKDKAGNYNSCSFNIHISVIRCTSPSSIDNGYYVCSPSNDYRYGGTCQYGCFRGYRMRGQSSVECRYTGDWSRRAPSCEKIQCPLLPALAHGKVRCSDWNNFQSKCSYLCDDGYRVPSGQNGMRVCGYTGHWRGGTPVCQDYERPLFRNCPVNRIAHTAKLSDYGVANWSDPDVTDNSEKAISVTWTGPSPGTALAVGTHRVTYNARDSAGNMAYPCIFTVNVRRLTCPVIYGKPYQRVSCPMGHRYGAMCHLSCDEGKNLTGKHNVSCELDSEYPPLTSWTWDLSQPKCEGSPCHPLQPPANGSLACDYWLYGRFCQMYCQEGTDLPRGSDDVGRLLVCNNNGEWTYKKKLPPCKKTRRPKKLRLLTELQYYTGDCCANDTQRRIRDVFVAQLNSSDYNQNNGVCYPPDCRVENVNVRCNPPCDGSSRHKRDIPVAIVEVSRTLDVMSNMSTQDNIQVATNLVSRLTDSMETQFAKVSLDVDMRFKSSEGRKPQMVCDDGLLPSATTLGCVPCSPGHFLNQTLSNCQPCPTGSYREDVAVLHCSPCPAGTTTRGLGTERREECLPQCSPGSYSSNGGLQPCTLCSVGTFTDETGAAQCRPCPPGTTTADEGSSQHALCKAFDVVFIPSAFQQHVSMTTSVTSQPEEVTLSLKLRLADGQNGSDWAEVVRLDYIVNRTSTTETVIRVAIATVNESQVIVEAHGCKVVSSGSTSMTQWQSISVSLNRTALVLCQNGDVFVNTDACKAPHDDDTENNTSAMRVTLGKQTDEAFFGEVTDVNVWDKTLTGSEIESATASCGHAAQGNVVSWRDMSMADLVGTSTQIPSLCDVTDDCAPAPCGNHTCVDKLGGYDCRCDDGFTGRHCQVNIDDCTDNACENNATCVDGVASYTCLCRESFYGNFCEHEIINGGWGDWGDWSQCSRSCGGGNTTRHRLCDSPPPDADGRPCDSDSEEWQECHTEECPVCGELQPPDHGSVNCSDGEEAINCTAVCDDGYEFSIESLDYYYCGPDTANRWSHQTEDNPHARIPDCAEMILPEKLTVQHSVQYADAPCNAKDVRAGVEARALEILALVPCIENGTCVMADLSARCISSDGHQGEQPPLTLTIALSVSDDEDKGDEANSTQEDAALGLLGAVEDLKTAVKVLQDRVEAGNFTVDVGGVEYIVAGQNVTGHASCALGMTRVSIVCVACSEGTYSRDEVCNKCPFGFYQDESQQTACKACPDGFKTMGTGSKTRQECVTCSPGTYEKNHGCEKCPVGFYQDLPAQTSCKACPPGYVSVDVGMEHATECNVTMAVTIASTDEPIQDNDIDKLAAGAASALGVVIGAVAGVIALVIIAVVVIVFIVKQCRR